MKNNYPKKNNGSVPKVALCMGILSLLALAAATWLKLKYLELELSHHLLNGTGAFEVLLAAAAFGLSMWGGRLAYQGSVRLPDDAPRLDQDDRTVRKYGGLLLAACAMSISLILLRNAQASTPEGKPPTFYDLMTWLGTFGTLSVVICGSLVAVYAKRREDDARKSDSVRLMRQEWINKVRDNVASVTEQARILYELTKKGTPDSQVASVTIGHMRRLELHLNPTEPHHQVLQAAMQSLLSASKIDEHLRGDDFQPLEPLLWGVLNDWVVHLAQLVLKIEWVVTSEGRAAVTAKAGPLWSALQKFEKKREQELNRVAQTAWYFRKNAAMQLVSAVPINTQNVALWTPPGLDQRKASGGR